MKEKARDCTDRSVKIYPESRVCPSKIRSGRFLFVRKKREIVLRVCRERYRGVGSSFTAVKRRREESGTSSTVSSSRRSDEVMKGRENRGIRGGGLVERKMKRMRLGFGVDENIK
ncbi:hypothetical protein HAX54_003198 [Datura stramonium]|uniref:Uncharacterized protein n=1 Tax=Datura stramonium TaxID=4076 RepID=A0ABS8T501_DATST|nr:hypothetical protein [Datura stramonium]